MRQKIYDALRQDATIISLVGADNVWSTYEEIPTTPYLVVRFGASSSRLSRLAEAEFFQVWAHDVPGDYDRIDTLLKRVQVVLEALPNEGDLFEVRWFETSQDMPVDLETGTISRFSRFQHISRR